MAALPDGKPATADRYGGGRILLWDPGQPGTSPQELGTHLTGDRRFARLAIGMAAWSAR